MIAAIVSSTLFLLAEAKAHSAQITAPAKNDAVQSRPWEVKAASDQIVNMCFWGMMWNGGNQGGYSTAAATQAFSTISFSSEFSETYETDTATTLMTTIPGGVVTVYGSDTDSDDAGVLTATTDIPVTLATAVTLTSDSDSDATATATAATDSLDDTDSSSPSTTFTDASFTSIATPLTTAASTAPAGFLKEVRMVESFAHELAEAIIAPSSMTALLQGAYKEVLERGFIHPTKAGELVNLASGAMKQLETDPAYSEQRRNLRAAPTPARFNLKNAMATFTRTHSAGLAKMTSVPEGRQAFHAAKHIAQQFVQELIE